MGLIAKVLSFTRVKKNGAEVSDVKVDPGGGINATPEHYHPLGDDAYPLTGDFAAVMLTAGTGRGVVVGYLDPLNTPKASEGERRIYARDPNSGSEVAEVWLKDTGEALVSNDNGNIKLLPDGGSIVTTPGGTFEVKADGSIKGDNGSGSFELQSGGDFLVNGVTIDTSGNITTAGTINADDVTADNQDVTLSTHTHNGGSVPAPDPGT